MIGKLYLLIILVAHASSESCVRYTFDEYFDQVFSSAGVCAGMAFWNLGKYSNTNLNGRNESSTTFISPVNTLSCVSSFMFEVETGGRLEVNIYMESAAISDQITVLVKQNTADGNGGALGTAGSSPMLHDYVDGWHTLVVNISSTGASMGYIYLLGMASANSVVLVDSFRYIPPNMDVSSCRLYEDEITTTEETVIDAPSTTTPVTIVPSTTTPVNDVPTITTPLIDSPTKSTSVSTSTTERVGSVVKASVNVVVRLLLSLKR